MAVAAIPRGDLAAHVASNVAKYLYGAGRELKVIPIAVPSGVRLRQAMHPPRGRTGDFALASTRLAGCIRSSRRWEYEKLRPGAHPPFTHCKNPGFGSLITSIVCNVCHCLHNARHAMATTLCGRASAVGRGGVVVGCPNLRVVCSGQTATASVRGGASCR